MNLLLYATLLMITIYVTLLCLLATHFLCCMILFVCLCILSMWSCCIHKMMYYFICLLYFILLISIDGLMLCLLGQMLTLFLLILLPVSRYCRWVCRVDRFCWSLCDNNKKGLALGRSYIIHLYQSISNRLGTDLYKMIL